MLALLLSTVLAFAGVTPPAVDVSLNPGDVLNVGKTVTTPPIPPNPDICFLADSTGSMGAALNSVKTNATSVMNQVQGAQPTAQFCVAEYRDIGDGLPIGGFMRLNHSMTASVAAAAAAINTWGPSGGGDTPEAQIPSLHYLATNPAVGFRTGSTRIIVWFGDSNGHNPRAGINLATAIASLQAANIQVVAIPVTAGGNGLDNGGQATAVVNATGGSIQPANPNAVAAAILAGLQNLPVTVTPSVVGCAPLNVSFAPAFQTVTSGNDANFTETITVPNNPALAGTKIVCSVDFKDNGNVLATQQITVTIPINLDLNPNTDTNELGPGADHTVTATVTDGNGTGAPGKTVNFSVSAGPNAGANGSDVTDGSGDASFTYAATQGLAGLGVDTITACVTDQDGVDHCDTVTKEWVDTTPPVAQCVESENPGGNKPKAPGEGGQGQNQDGFYQMFAEDIVDPNPAVFVVDVGADDDFDTADDFVFGPFPSATTFKYTEANGAEPSQKEGSGDVDWKLKGQGDAAVFAVDFSGNESDPVFCLVPPPPK
jgi:hypothetical protein